MFNRANLTPLEAAVPAEILGQTQATRPPEDGLAVASLPLQCRGTASFTLAELMVSVGVLVLLVFSGYAAS